MHNKNQKEKKNFAIAVENHQKNNFKIAANLYKKIIKNNPNHFESIFLLGSLSIQIKNLEAAEQLLNKAIQMQPNNAHAYHNLGILYAELAEFEKGIICSQKAIKIMPNHVEALNNLGNIYKELREFEKAKNSYQKAIQIHPSHTKSYNSLGNIFKELGDFEKAINFYQKTIKIQPNHAKAYYNLGLVFKILGNFQEAKKAYDSALKHEPNNLITLYDLSFLNEEVLNLKIKKKIEKVIKNTYYSKKNIAYGNFLLAKYELKRKNYEKELKYLLKGHTCYFESESKKFNNGIRYWLNELPKIKELSDFSSSITEESKIKPIFIIGVPRCGSTLIEKVIASSTKYISVGEETGILSSFVRSQIVQKIPLNQNRKNFQIEITKEYKQKELLQEKSDYIFTDKSLDNFFYVALIKEIFPNAKIINCRRNILSSIISILKTNLRNVSWAHNLDHIFKFFDIYFKKVEYFKKIFPNFIYDLEFEKFVDDPEIESKKLLNFCNLPWNIKCLEYYKRKDLISQTASNVQIRKSIFKTSIKKYQPYKKFLRKYEDKYRWFK